MSLKPGILFSTSDALHHWVSQRGDTSIICSTPPGAWLLVFTCDVPSEEALLERFPGTTVTVRGVGLPWGVALVEVPEFRRPRAC